MPDTTVSAVEMATAIWTHLDITGADGMLEVMHAVEVWHEGRKPRPEPEPCDCEEPFDLQEPRPRLTRHQAALLDALAAPRTTPELVGALGWRASVVGGVAASLHRRGLVVRIDGGLWSLP